MNKIKERFRDRFFRIYLLYTALETDLLFFVVCDAMFLTQVKQLSVAQVSLVTFLSILFSLIVQYPLLKVIKRIGNKAAVRAGSVFFLLAALCITFSSGFYMILIGGFLECIGYTFNSLGVAILKERLVREQKEDQYVTYQADANSAASFMMMLTALLCGYLFRMDAYFPMYACILVSAVGVGTAFYITHEDQGRTELHGDVSIRKFAQDQRHVGKMHGFIILTSFAFFTSITGTGLSYARLNVQELLTEMSPEFVVMMLGIISSLVYFCRMVSNLLLKEVYLRIKNEAMVLASAVLCCGLMLQLTPWILDTGSVVLLLSAGYLLMAFVRDPFVTIVQNLSLDSNETHRQQNMLVALNGARKLGALVLSASATLFLRHQSISAVMLLMTAVAGVNVLLSIIIWRQSK